MATGHTNAVYEIFAHTADVGLRVKAPNLNTLFADAGQALFSVIVANLNDVRRQTQVEINLAGQELDYLLLDWLSELLFTFETRRLLLSDFDLSIDAGGLKATAFGETVDPQRHEMAHEVKAVTYHGLKVEQSDNGWTAEVILDI